MELYPHTDMFVELPSKRINALKVCKLYKRDEVSVVRVLIGVKKRGGSNPHSAFYIYKLVRGCHIKAFVDMRDEMNM